MANLEFHRTLTVPCPNFRLREAYLDCVKQIQWASALLKGGTAAARRPIRSIDRSSTPTLPATARRSSGWCGRIYRGRAQLLLDAAERDCGAPHRASGSRQSRGQPLDGQSIAVMQHVDTRAALDVPIGSPIRTSLLGKAVFGERFGNGASRLRPGSDFRS